MRSVTARDGSAFELFVNGAPAGMLGPAGLPVLGHSIDEVGLERGGRFLVNALPPAAP